MSQKNKEARRNENEQEKKKTRQDKGLENQVIRVFTDCNSRKKRITTNMVNFHGSVPYWSQSSQCHKCSSRGKVYSFRGKETVANLASSSSWPLRISTQRSHQGFWSRRFMRLWFYHLSIRIQRPKTILEQVVRVIEPFDFAETRPIASETSFGTFRWFVSA